MSNKEMAFIELDEAAIEQVAGGRQGRGADDLVPHPPEVQAPEVQAPQVTSV